MQGSYRTVRIVEIRNLFLGRLRHRVRAVEQEDRDLLVGLLADIHGAMNALGRFFPVHLSRRDLDALAAVAIFNREEIATQNHSDPVKRIAMPRHCLAGSKAQAAHHSCSVVYDDFVRHCDRYAASAPTLQCAPSESTNCASTPPKSCFFGGVLKSTPFELMSR